jgi:hypothetical protein
MSNSEEKSGKGRPTPSRKEAQAGQKRTFMDNRDPKAARKSERESRAKARAGLMAGDARYFPARDQGPVKAFIRNYIDSRRTVGEFFVPGAFVVLLGGLIPGKAIQTVVISFWTALLIFVVIDTVILGFLLRKKLQAQFPNDSRKGAISYGLLRGLQMRRFRIPPPVVAPGGKQPKARKK